MRLTTFEADDDERLAVLAGRSEMDARTIFSAPIDGGRYAIVPVDDLEGERAVADAEELLLEEMRIVGDVHCVPADGAREVELRVDGEHQVSMHQAGAYGVLWFPQG